jgi:RND family efflux transporter MFP subunit
MYMRKPFMSPCYGYVATVMFLSLTGCQEDLASQDDTSGPAISHSVSLAQVESHVFPKIYSVPGTIVPSERLQIASRVAGYIEKITVDEGDIVEAGTILVEIDNAQVDASIKSAESDVVSAKAELEEAQGDVKRFRKLVRSKTITEDQLRKAIVRQTSAKANLAKTKAVLKSNQKDRQYTYITSPVRAQVRERLQDPGELSASGSPILRLDVLGPMELEVYLPSTRVGNVVIDQDVDVYVQSENTPLVGSIKSIVRSADKVTRRSKVRIALPEKQSLAPGQFARAVIVLGEELLTVVPLETVTERAGIEGVFIVDKNDTIRFRSIRIGKKILYGSACRSSNRNFNSSKSSYRITRWRFCNAVVTQWKLNDSTYRVN